MILSISLLQSLQTLYCTLVTPMMEYVSVEWNSIALSDACKLERIQQKFILLFHHYFFCHLDYSCGNVWNYLKLHTLSARRRYLQVRFSLTDFFNDSKYCPTLLEVGRGSSVGMETRYGLEVRGSRARFSRPALGPTQPPVQRVPGLSRE